MPCLIIVTEGQSAGERTVTLGAEGIIGREKANSIFIDDPRASRQHAKVTREPDGSFMLVDMGSRNGIIVNGEKVSRRKLIDKDRIVIGRTTLTYSEMAAESAPAPAQPAGQSETLKMASDDKTITAEPAKLSSNALQRAIQEVASTKAEGKAAPGAGKPAPAASGTPKGSQLSKTTTADEAIDEEPTLGKRIIVFLAFLIFFVTILLFAKEMTKRLLSKAEKTSPTPNISSPEKPPDK
ncbi:MAG: FHA domain-containing protein [Planctomycetes bacterium]|nr:FHA domain-containing protein [Planctomycetota bacterium]